MNIKTFFFLFFIGCNSENNKKVYKTFDKLVDNGIGRKETLCSIIESFAWAKNIDLNQYKGTGPNGRIIKKDIDDKDFNKISEILERDGK